LTISVSDTGVGIPPEEKQSVFDAFHQAGTSTKGVKEGTGLGLAITKRLVEEHGGRIWVESDLGRGTRLTFTIQGSRRSEDLTPDRGGTPPALRSRVVPLVLVVDDQASVRDLLRSWLEPAGYQVITAGSSSEALAKAAELSPDAVTLNVLGSGQGGWDALYTLKHTPATASIPIVAVTAAGGPNGLALGAAEYLAKPIERDMLLQTIRRHIGPCSNDPAKVLVVDDEPQARELLNEILEGGGYLPVLTGNGKEALAALMRIPVNAVLLDLVMPEMDGFEMLLRMQENSALRGIPVLVLTAKELSDGEVELLRRQTIGLFQKGHDWKTQLLADLRRAVGGPEPSPG
jgi:CheY-like chemotaxis protein